jgi:hypothetical protein
MRCHASLLVVLCSSLIACQKTAETSTVEPAAHEPQDPIDAAMVSLLTELARGEYEALQKTCVDPLRSDLSEEAFSDLSKIVIWWGVLESWKETKTDRSHGGGERDYDLQFERGGPVTLRVSLAEDGKLIGFRFGGKGFTEAEREVIADEWREFKVYDFGYLDASGERFPAGQPIAGNRVDYEIVVGGIEAFVGEHHLNFSKVVLDAKGKEVYSEPIEYDTKFAANAEGIPRGVVRGHVEVPGPGSYQMVLAITDVNSTRQLEHRQAFDVVKAAK